MNTKEITWLLVGGGVSGWLLFSAAQPPVPLDPPVATSVAQVRASTSNKLAFTNVPGYGLVPTDPTELAKLKVKLKADLDAAFKGTAFFTSHEEAVRAEETGEIAKLMGNIAKFYQREINNTIDSLIGLIEPIMIVSLGLGVGLLLVSVLMPIYNLAGSF